MAHQRLKLLPKLINRLRARCKKTEACSLRKSMKFLSLTVRPARSKNCCLTSWFAVNQPSQPKENSDFWPINLVSTSKCSRPKCSGVHSIKKIDARLSWEFWRISYKAMRRSWLSWARCWETMSHLKQWRILLRPYNKLKPPSRVKTSWEWIGGFLWRPPSLAKSWT